MEKADASVTSHAFLFFLTHTHTHSLFAYEISSSRTGFFLHNNSIIWLFNWMTSDNYGILEILWWVIEKLHRYRRMRYACWTLYVVVDNTCVENFETSMGQWQLLTIKEREREIRRPHWAGALRGASFMNSKYNRKLIWSDHTGV